MWKPGAPKPPDSKKKQKNQQDEEEYLEHAGHSTPSSSSPMGMTNTSAGEDKKKILRTKGLSGATMNMRFMMRTTRNDNNNHNNNNATTTTTTTPNHASPPATPTTTTSLHSQLPPQAQQQSQSSMQLQPRKVGFEPTPSAAALNVMESSEPPPSWTLTSPAVGITSGATVETTTTATTMRACETATPLEMFGREFDLLGRRSFGKFNVSMEHAWKSQMSASCSSHSSSSPSLLSMENNKAKVTVKRSGERGSSSLVEPDNKRIKGRKGKQKMSISDVSH